MSKIRIIVKDGQVIIDYPRDWGERCFEVGKIVRKKLEALGVKLSDEMVKPHEEEKPIKIKEKVEQTD